MSHICGSLCQIVTLNLHSVIYDMIPMCGILDGDKLIAIHRLSQVYQTVKFFRRDCYSFKCDYKFLNPCYNTIRCESFMKELFQECTLLPPTEDEVELERMFDNLSTDNTHDSDEDSESVDENINENENVNENVGVNENENVNDNVGVNENENVGVNDNENVGENENVGVNENRVATPLMDVPEVSQTSYPISINSLHQCADECDVYAWRIPAKFTEDFKDELRERLLTIFPLVVAADKIFGVCTCCSITNPHYTPFNCPKNLILEDNPIRIKTFRNEYAKGGEAIISPNEIVVKDNHISITFEYPLTKPATFNFYSSDAKGFTRLGLIHLICDKYHEIYKTEYQTATKHHYSYQTECDDCKREQLQPESYCGSMNPADICSICHEKFVTDLSKMPCNHIFHTKCIDSWLDRDEEDRKCPLCLRKCMKIEYCDDVSCKEGQKTIEYTDVVPNYEHRRALRQLLNRPASDGTYGISGHDIGDLRIEKLTYHPDKKIVSMFIGS